MSKTTSKIEVRGEILTVDFIENPTLTPFVPSEPEYHIVNGELVLS